MNSYLKGRSTLRRVLLLVDARHGLKVTDREIMDMLDVAAVSYQIILTKVDKSNKSDVKSLTEKIKMELARRPAAHPEIMLTSSTKGIGIEKLRAELAAMAEEIG